MTWHSPLNGRGAGIVRMAHIFLFGAALAGGCVHRIPLAEAYKVSGIDTLRERMAAARVAVRSYTAEVRLTSFGPQGRVRVSGSLAVKRPASFRYEIQGPQGGVVQAFATNGNT